MAAVWSGTAEKLLRHLAERGAEVRLDGKRLRCVPPGALTDGEAIWLEQHGPESVRALVGPDPTDVGAFGRWLRERWAIDCVWVGDAGPGATTWMPRPWRRRRPPQTKRRRTRP
jgi:hypothetical protein